MPVKDKNILDSVIYRYTTDTNQLEEENKVLKETINKLKEELDSLKKTPLMVCEVNEVDEHTAIIRIPNGNQFCVSISSECEKIKSGDIILAEQKNLTVIKKLDIARKFNVEKFVIIEKPTTSWKDIGGLDNQAREIKEVVELPLKKTGVIQKSWYQTAKRYFALWITWHWQDFIGKGCCFFNKFNFYRGCWF